MYKITEELKTNGFSIDTVESIVERNQGNLFYPTMEYFCIYIVFTNYKMTINNVLYTFDGPNLIFVGPGKEIVYGENYKDSNVFLVAFTSSFYERSTNDSMFLNSELFFNGHSEIFIAPTIVNESDIKKFIIERLVLYFNREKGLYISIAHNSVEALILDGILALEEKSLDVTKRNINSIDIVNKFKVLLQKHCLEHRTVTYYAQQLAITPKKLCQVCELALGKPPKKVIIEKLVDEAIKLLRYSNLTVFEIASKLHFSEEANFTRFIKTHTGKKPKHVRSIL